MERTHGGFQTHTYGKSGIELSFGQLKIVIER